MQCLGEKSDAIQLLNEAPMVRGLAANKFTKHNALHA